mgnify:CR=1 FL=1
MKKIVIIALLAVLVLPAPGVAQAGQQPIDISELNNNETACQTIDGQTSVCSAELVDGNTAELVIESSSTQRVTLTDGMALMTGGEIYQNSYTLTEGDNRIEFPVTQHRGAAAVSLDTGRVLFGLPLKEQTSLLDQPVTASDVQASALGGATSVGAVVLFMFIRAARGDDSEPERVA